MKTYLERLTDGPWFTVGMMYEADDSGYLKTDTGIIHWTDGDAKNWRSHQVGTLKEIGAQVGDEIRNTHDDSVIIVGNVDLVVPSADIYYITKRATPATPPTFGELTDAEQGAFLLAHHRGAVIESYDTDFNEFTLDRYPTWSGDVIYRIAKPAPAELHAFQSNGAWHECDKTHPQAKLFREVTE